MNDEYSDRVGAYVLDALAPDEQAAFEEHLLNCSACQAEVAELRQVVSVLSLAVEEVEPSPELRDRIITAIREGEPDRPALTLVQGARSPSPRRLHFSKGSGLLAIAAAVVIAALGAWNVNLQQNSTDNSRRMAIAEQVLKADLDHPAVAIMPGKGIAQGAVAKVIQPQHGNSVFMVVNNLPSPPSGKVYQLWVMQAGATPAPVSAGVFTSQGNTVQFLEMPRPKTGYPLTALTVEPGPHGSRAPTTSPVMSGKFTA